MGSTSTQVSEHDEANDFLLAMQLVTGSVMPMVLKSVIELGVLETIAGAGPGALLSPSEIASQLPTNNPDAPFMLDRILCLLASYSVVTCSLRYLPDGKVERLYGCAPVCKYLINNEEGVSLSCYCLRSQGKDAVEIWDKLKDAVLEGGVPFNKAQGMGFYEWFDTNPEFNRSFYNFMSSHSTITMKKILEIYKGFEGLNSLVDVGGGKGAALNMIISKHPSIKGINFDLPHVIRDAPPHPGVVHVEGDMFVSVPKADAIFLKWICHNWSDEHCLKLLKNCYAAVPHNGKVIVCDSILPVAPNPSLESKVAFHFDCIMMSNFEHGKERTEDEFKALAKKAGFQDFQLVCNANDISIMELNKKSLTSTTLKSSFGA